jgi:hypothetical protein
VISPSLFPFFLFSWGNVCTIATLVRSLYTPTNHFSCCTDVEGDDDKRAFTFSQI